MRQLNLCVSVAWVAALSIGVSAASEQPMQPTGASEPAVWQHHKELINYYGVTETYTCTGIEDKVRELLLYFGARKDGLKVTPLCSRQLAPMHQVFVRVEFDSLAPAGGASNGGGGEVNGQWADLHVLPTDPLFRDRGECELFQHLKEVLMKDFTVRDVHYRTDCTPYETTLQDYSITGQVLVPPGHTRWPAAAASAGALRLALAHCDRGPGGRVGRTLVAAAACGRPAAGARSDIPERGRGPSSKTTLEDYAMRQQQRFAVGVVAAVIGLAGTTLALAQAGQAQDQAEAHPPAAPTQLEITVQAAGTVRHQSQGTTYTGIPLEDISLTRRVGVSDLNLNTAEGKSRLEHRVRTVAKEACRQLLNMYPLALWTTSNAACVHSAVQGAMDQLPTIMARAGKSYPAR